MITNPYTETKALNQSTHKFLSLKGKQPKLYSLYPHSTYAPTKYGTIKSSKNRYTMTPYLSKSKYISSPAVSVVYPRKKVLRFKIHFVK